MKPLLILVSLVWCTLALQGQSTTQDSIAQAQKAHIVERAKTWGEAIRTKNVSLLEDLYAENAHYLPDDSEALHGREAIVSYWTASLPFMGDLTLYMESLEGTEDLLYETGTGLAKIMNEEGAFDNFYFKYVNVWTLNPDGRYQVVIDTFNGLGK